jgi:hypothetical protein
MTKFSPKDTAVIIIFIIIIITNRPNNNSVQVFIYLSANLTAQRLVTNQGIVKEKESKQTQNTEQSNLDYLYSNTNSISTNRSYH